MYLLYQIFTIASLFQKCLENKYTIQSFSDKSFSTWRLLDHKGEKQSCFFVCIVAFPLTMTVTRVYDKVHCYNMGQGQSLVKSLLSTFMLLHTLVYQKLRQSSNG